MLNGVLATLAATAVLALAVSCGGAVRTEPTATSCVSVFEPDGIVTRAALGTQPPVPGFKTTIVPCPSPRTTTEPSTRIETRTEGPSGQPGPIDVIVPNYPANPGTPWTSGPFRILPYGFNPTPPPAPPLATVTPDVELHSTDPTMVASAPFFAKVSYVPAGFSYAEPWVSLMRAGKPTEIVWRFPGKDAAEIQISRGLRSLPVEVSVPPPDSWVELKEGSINGNPAIFLVSKPGQGGPQSLYFVDGDVTTEIIGDVADFDELVKVAESLH